MISLVIGLMNLLKIKHYFERSFRFILVTFEMNRQNRSEFRPGTTAETVILRTIMQPLASMPWEMNPGPRD